MQRLAAVAVPAWDRTQKDVECDWLTKKASAGPIAEPATEPQQPAPATQQEPSSSSSGLAVKQLDSPMEMGAQERRERKGARPSETPSSEFSERPVVKARPASPPTIGPTAEGSGTIVFSATASSSKDKMMIGGLCVIDGIDVLATLVPEEDAWQFEAAGTCTIETQLRDREQESVAFVDNEDPSTSETVEAYDARTGEKLDSEEVRKGRAKEVRELDEFEVKMEVDESETRVTLGKKIWSKWVETRKDPNSPAIRCGLCATEVNTGEPRSDTFAATSPLKFVRLIWSWAASCKPKRANASMIIAVFDISVAFFHGKVRKVIYVVPLTRVKCDVRGGRLDVLGRSLGSAWRALGRRFHLQHSR